MCDECSSNRKSYGKSGNFGTRPYPVKLNDKPKYTNVNNGDKFKEPKTYVEKTLDIWDKVWAGDKEAQAEFIILYIGRFPQNIKITQNLTRDNLLVMYVQMTQSNYNR